VWTKKESSGTSSAVASKFGGGGNPCTVCAKTVYTAETVSFEKKIYHPDCFKCSACTKVLKAADAAQFVEDDKISVFCRKCFKEGGYSGKQAAQKGKGTKATSAIASKFGGGGTPCAICTKSVYPAEALPFEKKIYHSECFKCSTCDKKMTSSQGNVFDEKLLCTKCFGDGGYRQKQTKTHVKKESGSSASGKFSKFGGGGTKCVRCVKTVYSAELVSFEKNAFHGECFTCLHCDKKMSPSGAEGKNKPDGTVDVYCKKCWGEQGMNRKQLVKAEAAEETPEETPAAAEEETAAAEE